MKFCDYGCGEEALFQFKNGTFCCNKNWRLCSINRKKNSELEIKAWKDPVKRSNILDGQEKTRRCPEVIQKRSKAIIEIWKDPVKRKKMIDGQNRLDVKEKYSGPNHPNWNSNRVEVCMPYTEKFYDKIFREQIKREQNYLDPITKELLTEKSCLHHIDYNKQNDSRENLVWLNIGTHSKTTFNREEWSILLLKMNRDIISESKREGW